MLIEDRWPCPKCGNRRTVRWSERRFVCFQCRHHWERPHPPAPAAGRPAPAAPAPPLHFSPTELERLLIYRDAIRAGFYTDALPV
jgi:hypothetical protein